MRILLHKNNITQYFTKFQDLNNIIRLNGYTIKKMVPHAIPKKLIKLIYSRYNIIPLNNLKFIAVIRDTDLIYKSFIL